MWVHAGVGAAAPRAPDPRGPRRRKRFHVVDLTQPAAPVATFVLPDARWCGRRRVLGGTGAAPPTPGPGLRRVTGMVQLAFPPASGAAVAAAATGTAITCWDVAANAEVQTWTLHPRAVTCLDWSPLVPGRLASSSGDRTLLVCDLRAPRPAAAIKGPAGASQVRWSPHDPHVLASAHDGIVKLWDLRKPAPQAHITAHMSKITSLVRRPRPPTPRLTLTGPVPAARRGTRRRRRF